MSLKETRRRYFTLKIRYNKKQIRCFYFCFMYVSNVFLFGTEAVSVSFYKQKSILTVVFIIKRFLEYEFKRNEKEILYIEDII